MNWTREQMQVIESRDSNLLVSAAAGSGKTAVLVERIIRMVTEGEHPLDIDRLLVMTFTNAAASEMRERIGAAIEKKLEEMPENEHLQMQAALVHHARITTIDSFCLDLIRNHFNMLDLDPSFRIGDEGELILLRADVMQEMLEDYYTDGGERFVAFVETYARGKNDAGIEDLIMQVYTFSQSNPYPGEWFARCRRELEGNRSQPEEDASSEQDPKNFGSFHDFSWVRFLTEDLKNQAGELIQQLGSALEICRQDEILEAYSPMLELDMRQLAGIGSAEDFEDIHRVLSGISWTRLAAVRNKNVDSEKKAYVTGCRDRVKKAVSKMREQVCFAEPGEMLQDLAAVREPVGMLLELAEEFARRYQEKKREKNLVDFNDLEHEALKVLILPKKEAAEAADGLSNAGKEGHEVYEQTAYTEAADELSRQFAEVLVDEYQDSNLVQETLLHAVSQERFGNPNVFMVGDVKQSIYKFRLARPELFLEKYHTYEDYDQASGTNKKIELHQNFRSRAEVLEGINDVFYRIMTEELGGIRYTEDTALHPGAVFPETGQGESRGELLETDRSVDGPEVLETDRGAGSPELLKNNQGVSRVELLVMDTGAEAFAGLEEDAADFTARELEAKLIAGKIREMTNPDTGLLVWDKNLNNTGGYRTARYRDMVVLLRSTAGWTENLLSVLMNEGIPACAESRMGYFAAVEVEIVLSMLAVIDNPMQDIPLAAVLKSPMVGVTDLELAELTAYYRSCADKGQDRGVFAAVSRFLEDMSGEGEQTDQDKQIPEERTRRLYRKLYSFRSLLRRFRAQSTYLPIHELIYKVYEQTGYYHYVSAMPAGETRRANLDMLVEKAADYERTSYKGLFHFIRYIENLKKYNTDFGEASTMGEEEDTVRIMIIHKSKFIEFPVVFLAGMGKKFNNLDDYGKVLIDPELGIATDYLDLERRLKTTTLKKNVLRRKMELDNLGEELRVLYVAMTRAKEKLIMTGTDRHLTKALEKYAQIPLVNGQVPYTILAAANSYLDWVLMSLSDGKAKIRFVEIPLADVVGEELIRQVRDQRSKETLLNLDLQREYQKEYRELLEDHLDYEYPYRPDIRLHTKMSVSELKKQGQMEDESESAVLFQEGKEVREKQQDVTHYLQEISRSDGYGATRGTAYHRAMELLPFSRMESQEDVVRYLSELTEKGRFGRESLDLIDCSVIWRFLQSKLGRRMSLAEKEGRLHKEQQFVVGIPARDMKAGDSDELVVVQGIIDAYIEEDEGLVVVDYKTDKVSGVRILLERYREQLDYYGRALEQMTGKKVRARILYSLTMQREIVM